MNRSRSASHIDQLEARRLLAFTVGGDGLDYGTASALLADGGTVVAGLFSGTVSFDPASTSSASTLTSVGTSDVFVARYDASEQLVWVRQIGGIEGRFEIDERLDRAVDVAINPRRAGGEFFVNGVGPDPQDAGEYVNALAVAPEGSIYLTGGFRGRIDFDPGPGRRVLDSDDFEFYDIFVMKLTAGGDFVWANRFGGQFTDVGNDIALDPVGNPYITGVFTRTADFHPGSSVLNLDAVGRNDIFVMKLSVNGKLIWVSAFGSEEIGRELTESGNAIAVDAIGNAYVTGAFAGLADFNPTPGPAAQFFVDARDETDAFVMQLSTRGKLAWVRTFGGFEFDGGTALALGGSLDAPDVFVGGYFEEEIDVTVGDVTTTLRPAPQRRGDRPVDSDLLISRYTNDGTLVWAKQIGGGGYETVADMATDDENNIYFTGGYWGDADFDPSGGRFTLSSIASPFEIDDANERRGERFQSYDAYFAALSAGGALRFASSFGGDQDDFGIGLSSPRPGTGTTPATFALIGRIAGNANLDPSGSLVRSARGRGDVFVSIFGADAELV